MQVIVKELALLYPVVGFECIFSDLDIEVSVELASDTHKIFVERTGLCAFPAPSSQVGNHGESIKDLHSKTVRMVQSIQNLG